MQFFQKNFTRRHGRVHESEIQMFHELPESLMVRLHEEMYTPVLATSAYFVKFIDVDRPLIANICHQSFRMTHYLPHQECIVKRGGNVHDCFCMLARFLL